MSEIFLVVEGQTEQTFVRDILAPYMGIKRIFLKASIIGKPGKKGGDIQFHRAQKDIGNFLAQRSDTYVSTMFDYFRIDSQWPGMRQNTNPNSSATEKARILEKATAQAISDAFPNTNPNERFIPYIQMHEFEALLFSNAEILSSEIGVDQSQIEQILHQYDDHPEEINQTPENAPSKQLEKLKNGYRKVIMGNTIGQKIGVEEMRKKCPHFNEWLTRLEEL